MCDCEDGAGLGEPQVIQVSHERATEHAVSSLAQIVQSQALQLGQARAALEAFQNEVDALRAKLTEAEEKP